MVHVSVSIKGRVLAYQNTTRWLGSIHVHAHTGNNTPAWSLTRLMVSSSSSSFLISSFSESSYS